ncbi:MAG: hypothetical protein L3J13_00875 [Devosiaceae bacterium]|nr:hypothetical protein [Devosiaceae bacterium]
MKFLFQEQSNKQAEAEEVFKELTWHLAGALKNAMQVSSHVRSKKTRSKLPSAKSRSPGVRSTSAAVGS